MKPASITAMVLALLLWRAGWLIEFAVAFALAGWSVR